MTDPLVAASLQAVRRRSRRSRAGWPGADPRPAPPTCPLTKLLLLLLCECTALLPPLPGARPRIFRLAADADSASADAGPATASVSC